jgi:hypothetical protein
MATAAQITANQLNAQASTGPRTEAGKQTVSRNAFAHGLAAKKFFVSEADKTVFAEFRDALAEHYQPATDHERALLEEYAEALWRRRTARTMETSFLEIAIEQQRKADPKMTFERALAGVFMDQALQKRMSLMMRYLAAAERTAEKAGKQLESVIAEREYQQQRQAEVRAMIAMRQPAPPPLPSEPANRVCSAIPQRC